MSKLPPVAKFPLSVRKNVRDEWENKKEELESKLSEVLTVPWTIEADLNQIYAYANTKEGYAKERLGSCVFEHFESNIGRLKEYEDKFGEEGLKDINTICFKHVLTLDVDVKNAVRYGGADVQDGVLRILFGPECISTNIGQALGREALVKALNEAPVPEGSGTTLSFLARLHIRDEYDSRIDEIRTEVGTILERSDIKLSPGFEENFGKLVAEGAKKKTSLDKQWERSMGNITRLYFEGLVSQLKWQKFDEDDMLREALNEAVEKGEFALRIVDKLKGSYCEWEIEDGVLYIQCLSTTWGSNIDNAVAKLVDGL